MVDFSVFDSRKYPTLDVRKGYGHWAATYEDTVLDLMDLRLLAQIDVVNWAAARHVLDMACGTGRIGQWLKTAGVGALEGIDITPEMLAIARSKGLYSRLHLGDITATGLEAGTYDLITVALADEHLADVSPLYHEARRLTTPEGQFVIVGYHPHFLMAGIAVHFRLPSGENVAVKSYVHQLSDHVRAAHAAGLHLREMHEGLIDDAWVAAKPKWAQYRHRPVSFAMVWNR